MGVLDDALALAQRYSPIAQVTQTMLTLQGALEDLRTAELGAVESGALLAQLKTQGLAAKQDFTAWDTIRANLFDIELSFFGPLRGAIRVVDQRIDSNYAASLPAPQIFPSIARPTRGYPLQLPAGYQMPVRLPRPANMMLELVAPGDAPAPTSGAGTSGLGLAPIAWAAIALGVVATIATVVVSVFVLQTAIEAIAHVAVVKAQVQQYRDMLQARLSAYQTCMAESAEADGEGAEARSRRCLEVAGFLIPTPQEAGLAPEAPDLVDTGWYVVGGGAAVVAVALGYVLLRFYGKSKGISGPPVRRRTRQRLPRPRRVYDLEGPSEYDLEIDD